MCFMECNALIWVAWKYILNYPKFLMAPVKWEGRTIDVVQVLLLAFTTIYRIM
jgi:hypothetical protein